MPTQEEKIDAMISRVDAGLAEHHAILTTIGTQTADLLDARLDSRTADVEKALNELAILVNQTVVRLVAADDANAASLAYLTQKNAEHQTQLSELFGDTPDKLTRRSNLIAAQVDAHSDQLRDHETRLDTHDNKIERLQSRADDIVRAVARHTSDPELHVLA